MKRIIRNFLIVVLIISSSALGLRAQGVYSLTPQPVCWSYNGVDSSLLSLLVFNVRDTVGIFQGYVNAVSGSYVNTTAGGTVSAGYCCCDNSGSSQTVSITDNDDGTYTAVVGTDTTIIYTKADSLYTTTSISLGDTTYLANSVVQDILIALSQEVNNLRSETGCELEITQNSHGFTAGDLITQDPNTGAYSAAAADTSINFPVAYVCSVIDANTFRVDTEGWVSGTHGETVYRDYFLQDTAGDTDTTAGSFPIFAYRTFSPTLRYYDIPEYIAEGNSGGDTWLKPQMENVGNVDVTSNRYLRFQNTSDSSRYLTIFSGVTPELEIGNGTTTMELKNSSMSIENSSSTESTSYGINGLSFGFQTSASTPSYAAYQSARAYSVAGNSEENTFSLQALSTNNNDVPAFELYRGTWDSDFNSSDPVFAGFRMGRISWFGQNQTGLMVPSSANNKYESAYIEAVTTDTFSISKGGSEIGFYTTETGTVTKSRRLLVGNNGQLTVDDYGSGSFTGTPAYSISVESDGDLIEIPNYYDTATITGDGDGEQTIAVSFSSAMPDATYTITLGLEISSGTPSGAELYAYVISGKTTGGFTISLGEAIETGEEILVHWEVKDN